MELYFSSLDWICLTHLGHSAHKFAGIEDITSEGEHLLIGLSNLLPYLRSDDMIGLGAQAPSFQVVGWAELPRLFCSSSRNSRFLGWERFISGPTRRNRCVPVNGKAFVGPLDCFQLRVVDRVV